MRFIVALAALAGIAWFLSSRQRRDQLQQTVQDAPSGDLQQQAGTAASTIANAARSAGGTVVERAQEVAANAQQAVSDAAPKVQQAVSDVAPKVQQAADKATTAAQQAVGDATSRVQQAVGDATSGNGQTEAASAPRAQDAPQTQQAADGTKTAAHSTSAVETDVNTPPSVRDMVQTELADVAEQVDTLRAQSELPVDPAENSPQAAGISGVMDTSILDRRADAESRGEPTVTGSAPVPSPAAAEATASTVAPATDQTSRGANDATQPGGAGQGQNETDTIGHRPRPIAGEGTTTATGGAVNPLSPDSDGHTSTGIPEPLPAGLTAGEPGTGGPAGSSQAPTIPDSSETPTTGMDHTVIDRASEVEKRTSGDYIGNTSTRVFHAATAPNLPGEKHRVYFESEEEALAAGFRPAEH